MTNKLMLSLLGAGFVMGMTVPAFAQSDRSRGANQSSAISYAQDAGRYDQNARSDQRSQNIDYRSDSRRGGKTLTFNTRYRATIVLTEDTVRGRKRSQNVCTVSVRGPQSRLVPKQSLRQIARNNCSRRASVRINT